MIKRVIALGFVLLLSSCGALRLKPIGCMGEGTWSLKHENEISFTEGYFVWFFDHEVLLKDFLKERNIDCRKISKMHIKMRSIFFVKRELTVFVQK